MDEEDEDEYMDGNQNRSARNNKNMLLQVKSGAMLGRNDNHSGGVENFDDSTLRSINRRGREKSVTFKLPSGNPENKIMVNEGAGNGPGFGNTMRDGGIQVNNEGSSRVLASEENDMAANYERAEGSNRERASTMDLKSNQGR